MKKRLFFCLLAILMSCVSSVAQQAKLQPLTFWYVYTINSGKEDEFIDLIKTVGQPVRDKLMAEGVVLAWGVQTSMLRVPGMGTHWIWYVVNDWSGIEKVDGAMRAQIAKFSSSDSTAAAGKKGAKPGASVSDRLREIADMSKTHDYITRGIVSEESSSTPAGVLPYTRYNFIKVKPGKAADYRKAWEKYNKPVFDKLLADGVILGYGLEVEEVRTSGEFTHFVWLDTKDLGAMEKFRAAFLADRDHRTQEEQDAIGNLFNNLVDADASRSEIARSLIFHVPAPK
jgi:hypothetical protein